MGKFGRLRGEVVFVVLEIVRRSLNSNSDFSTHVIPHLCPPRRRSPWWTRWYFRRNRTPLRKHAVGHDVLPACRSVSMGSISSIAKCIVQKGASGAVGMSFNLEIASDAFTAAFYGKFLGGKATFEEAAAHARNAMRAFPTRKPKFNTTVDIGDFISPLTFWDLTVSPKKEIIFILTASKVNSLLINDESKSLAAKRRSYC